MVLRVRIRRRPSNLLRLAPAKGVTHEASHRRARRGRTAARTSCSLVGGDDDSGGDASTRVVLVTHESFVLPRSCSREFEEESGYDLVVRAAGDAGALTNKLVLTKDDPTGDVVFGIDNTFAVARHRRGRVRAVRRDAARRAPSTTLLAGDDDDAPHADRHRQRLRQRRHTWFAEHGLPRRRSLDDLIDPAYEDLLRHPRRDHELARAGLPARHDRGVRRGRLAGLLDRADGQRRQAHRRAGRTPTRSTSPRAAGAATGRSWCPTTPRRRSPSTATAARRPARCSTPASARSSTPGCWPARTTRRARRRWSTSCSRPRFQEALPDAMYVFPVDAGADAARRTGRSSPQQPDRPARRRPGRDRRPPRRVAARVERRHHPVTADDARAPHPRRPGPRAGAGAGGLLRAAGRRHGRPRLRRRRPVRPRRGGSRCWPGRARTGCCGSRSGRPGSPRCRACCSGCRRPTSCTGCASRCRDLIRALLLVPFVLPTVVVGVAFRQLLGESGPLGFLGLDGTPVAIIAGLVFFNVAVVIRAVGATWESLDAAPGRGRGRARRLAGARCSAPSRCRRCGRRSCRRPAWCSCSARRRSASCSPSAGCATPRSRPRSTCSPPSCSTCQAAAALSLAAAARGHRAAGRRGPAPGRAADPTVERRVGAAPAPAPPGPRRSSRSPRLVLAPGRGAGPHPGGRLAARRRRAGAWTTTAR